MTIGELSAYNIILYGAGNLGRKLYNCLKINGKTVMGFIDENVNSISGVKIPIWKPCRLVLGKYIDSSIIILAGLFGKTQEIKIRKKLTEIGFTTIISLRDIEWNTIRADEFLKNMFIGEFSPEILKLENNRIMLKEIQGFFNKRENDFIMRYIEAHRCRKYLLLDDPLPLENQYLAEDVDCNLDLSCFVDAGAFDGDVLRRFFQAGKTIDTYIAFEPQGDLCYKIRETIKNGNNHCKSFIFPCGLSDKWEKLHFLRDDDGISAAKVADEGETSIQCLPLDEALIGINPTFIKMDIEGMELKALHGAKEIISKYHPQLAICVYHELSHLWEIPLYIKKLYPNYKFAIRNYQYMGLETVVYAYV